MMIVLNTTKRPSRYETPKRTNDIYDDRLETLRKRPACFETLKETTDIHDDRLETLRKRTTRFDH